MFRALGPLLGIVMFGVWIYAIFDSIATDAVLVRNLPKTVWVLLVLFFGPIGAIAWLGFGRPTYAGWRPGDTSIRPRRIATGPEDSDQWTHGRPPMAAAPGPSAEELAEREARLRAWEADLRRRDDQGPDVQP